MTKFETLLLEKEEGVALVKLNRPERLNALNLKMVDELNLVLDKLRLDGEVKVIVITGVGRAFCVGADINELAEWSKTPQRWVETLTKIGDIIIGVREVEKPVIAAVNGHALGFGCGLALACDIRIASENAKFGERFVRVGLNPGDGDTLLLPLTIGVGRATQMLLTGEDISAEKAEAMGIVSKVVPTNELEVTVKKLAIELSKGALKAIAFTKLAINRWLVPLLRADLKYSHLLQSLLTQTRDFREALKAFSEKRKPIFTGE